jgi:hypothetical protein
MLIGCVVDQVGIAAFGYSQTEPVEWTKIGDSSDGLNNPRDLGFNPEAPSELWVVNRVDDSVSIFSNAGASDQSSQNIIDPYALHFMEEVSSIEFGKFGTFGTCQESRNTYNGSSEANDFMGPTLWSSDLDVFGETNPDAVRFLTNLYGFHTNLGSHLDMLHETPLCMGIAWQYENVYWAFNGLEGSIDRNNFHVDHGPGFDDHSDGTIYRYGEGQFERVPDVPSHMKYDHNDHLLYIADTGNNAIKVLDIVKGEPGDRLAVKEPGTEHFDVVDEDIWTLIDGKDFGMEMPSGITIVDEVILVTDNATSTIFAFTLDGELIDQMETDFPSGALMGIYAVSLDDLWFVNAVDNEIWRLQPVESESSGITELLEYTFY